MMDLDVTKGEQDEKAGACVSNSNGLGHANPPASFHFGMLDAPMLDAFQQSSKGGSSLEGKNRGLTGGTDRNVGFGSVQADTTSRSKEREGIMAPPSRKRGPELSDERQTQGSTGSQQRPIRPTAISYVHSADSVGRSSQQRSAVGSLGMETSKLEGSATSDEYPEASQSRLVPRRGAGPDLRNEGGSKIDEYLMRLLRTGLTPSGPNSSTQNGFNANQNGNGQGSRLGPLAPGAGIKASSVRQNADNASPQHYQGGSVAPVQASGNLGRPVKSGEAMQQSGSTASLRQPAQATSRTPMGSGIGGGSSLQSTPLPQTHRAGPGGGQDLSSKRARRLLGDNVWHGLQMRIMLQKQEFDSQLYELHRLVDLQKRLSSKGEATPSFAAYQEPRLQASLSPEQQREPMQQSSRPPLEAWWLNSAAWDPAAFGLASWQQHLNNSPGHALQTKSDPDLGLSRTTRIALDAQRARRGSKARGLTTGSHSADAIQAPGRSSSVAEQQGEDPSKAGVPDTSANWSQHMQPYLQPNIEPPQGTRWPVSPGSVPKHLDPLKGWYQYHFHNNTPGHKNAGDLPDSARAMQFAGLSLAPPTGGWEDQCQDFFNYSMAGTSDVNEPGQASRATHLPQRQPHGGVTFGSARTQSRPMTSAGGTQYDPGKE